MLSNFGGIDKWHEQLHKHGMWWKMHNSHSFCWSEKIWLNNCYQIKSILTGQIYRAPLSADVSKRFWITVKRASCLAWHLLKSAICLEKGKKCEKAKAQANLQFDSFIFMAICILEIAYIFMHYLSTILRPGPCNDYCTICSDFLHIALHLLFQVSSQGVLKATLESTCALVTSKWWKNGNGDENQKWNRPKDQPL